LPKYLDTFESAHPDVHVLVESYPYSKLLELIELKLSAKTDEPDVLFVDVPLTSADTAKGYLYVQVNVLLAENMCAANIYVSFRTSSVIESNQQLTVASIWNENIIGAAWPNGAPQEITLAVENLTKKFIEDWAKDNGSRAAKHKT